MAIDNNQIDIIINAKDQFSKTLGKASLGLQSFQTAAIGFGVAAAGITAGFGKALQTSIDFESAFTGVRKTVELSEAGFAQLEQNFKDITKVVPIAFTELAAIGEIAGQLGVEGVDNITKFSKVIADVSETTSLTAEQAATDFARIANIMGEPLDNVDRMASAMVGLGNNFATTETEISAFAQRIAGAGKIVGLTTPDVFAIGAALSSVGIEAEAGGTAVQTGLLKINEAVINGGEDLETFAKTAKLSSKAFSKLWAEDSAQAFEKFVLGLGKSGDAAVSILDDVGLGGIRTSRSFLSLANAGDLISDALQQGTTDFDENIAAADEAEKRYKTLASKIQKAKNKFTIIADEIGDKVVPIINDILLPALDNLMGWWVDLEDSQKDFILTTVAVSAALMAITAAIALLTFVISPLLIAMGLVITIVALLISIFLNWDTVIINIMTLLHKFANFMTDIWERIRDSLLVIWAATKNAFFKEWNAIMNFFEDKINSLIYGINLFAKASDKVFGTNFGLIADIDFSAAKGEITDISKMVSDLEMERQRSSVRRRMASEHIIDEFIDSRTAKAAQPTVNIDIGSLHTSDPDEMIELLQEKFANVGMSIR